MRPLILVVSFALVACSVDGTSYESSGNDAAAPAREMAITGNSQVSQNGHYFGYGLQIDGIADCSEIERTAGPIGFRHCVADNVAVVEQQLDRAVAAAPSDNNAAQLPAWKTRTIGNCERLAEAGGWGGGTDFYLVVDDCYGKKIVKKLAELKDARQ